MGELPHTLHPGVFGLYFLLVLTLTMVFLQPVCVLVSWLGAVLCWLLLFWGRGLHEVGVFALGQIAIVGLVTLGNMLFSDHGQTVLFVLSGRVFSAESAGFGACMGLMLGAVMTWFIVLYRWVTPDEVRELGGGFLPTISLMLSMMLAYFPQMLSRGKKAFAVMNANTAAVFVEKHLSQEPLSDNPGTPSKGLRAVFGERCRMVRQTRLLRVLSVLLGWSLEDSLVQTSSMQARGYGYGKRSCFRQRRWTCRDTATTLIVVGLGVLAIMTGFRIVETFSFYPVWSGWQSWSFYIPSILFVFLPVFYLTWLKCRCSQ